MSSIVLSRMRLKGHQFVFVGIFLFAKASFSQVIPRATKIITPSSVLTDTSISSTNLGAIYGTFAKKYSRTNKDSSFFFFRLADSLLTEQLLNPSLQNSSRARLTSNYSVLGQDLGMHLMWYGLFEEAENQYKKVIRLCENQNPSTEYDLIEIGILYTRLAQSQYECGKFSEAKVNLNHSKEQFANLEYQDGVAMAYYHLGKSDHLQAKYLSALDSYEYANAILRQLGRSAEGISVAVAMGETYLQIGEWEHAENLFLNVVEAEAINQVNWSENLVRSSINLAVISRIHRNDPVSGIQHLKILFNPSIEVQEFEMYLIAEGLYELSRQYMSLDSLDKALRYMADAQNWYLKDGNLNERFVIASIGLGMIHIERGEFDKALAYADTAETTVNGFADKEWLWSVADLRLRALKGLGNYKGALEITEYMELLEDSLNIGMEMSMEDILDYRKSSIKLKSKNNIYQRKIQALDRQMEEWATDGEILSILFSVFFSLFSTLAIVFWWKKREHRVQLEEYEVLMKERTAKMGSDVGQNHLTSKEIQILNNELAEVYEDAEKKLTPAQIDTINVLFDSPLDSRKELESKLTLQREGKKNLNKIGSEEAQNVHKRLADLYDLFAWKGSSKNRYKYEFVLHMLKMLEKDVIISHSR